MTVVSAAVGLLGCSNKAFTTPGTIATTTGGGALTAGGATVVYAIENGSFGSQLLQFSLASSSGSLTPSATLTPPTGVTFKSVATDSSGTVYVGAYTAAGQGEVLVYPAGPSGTQSPTRTILGGTASSTTTFGEPLSMHVSSSGTLAILSDIASGYSVATMPAASSTGAVTPATLLVGSATQMTGPQCVTIDQNGKVYVTNYASTGSILEFAASATGNAAPSTVITTGTLQPYGIAADASGDVFTMLDYPAASAAGTLTVYGSGASGAATPTRSISGSATGLYFGGGVRLDSVGNLYVINSGGSGGGYDLLAFPQSASGNVSPGLYIASSALSAPDAEIAVR